MAELAAVFPACFLTSYQPVDPAVLQTGLPAYLSAFTPAYGITGKSPFFSTDGQMIFPRPQKAKIDLSARQQLPCFTAAAQIIG